MENQEDPTQDMTWEVARMYSGKLGSPPDMLALCIRSLVKCHGAGSTSLDFASEFLLSRLVRSKTMQAKLYYIIKDLHPEKMEAAGTWSVRELCRVFSPYDYAAFLSLIAMHRQAKKKCPKEDWERQSVLLYNSSTLGHHLGRSIKAIGSSVGLLVGSMRHIVFCIYAGIDTKKLKEYRIGLKTKKKSFDLKEEIRHFGTTHPQVISVLLQRLGYGVNYTHLIEQALGNERASELSKEAVPARVASMWLDALLMTGQAPETHVGDEYDMSDTDLERLVQVIKQINDGSFGKHWLLRNKDDLTPEDTPEVFAALVGSSDIKEDAKADESKNGNLSEHFTAEEIDTINSEVQEISE